MVIVVAAETVVPTWNVAMLPLPLTVTPEGRVQSMQLAGIGTPLLVWMLNVKLLPGAMEVADRFTTVMLVIVLEVTKIGTTALCPPEAAVTVCAVPPDPGVGVTVVVADPVVGLMVISAPLLSDVVQFGVMVELLPLTSVPVADNCRVPAPVAELMTAVFGVTVRVASEFGETKKPLQPIINPATATRLIRARTAVPVLDIAPP
jgi:hypothetical protein